MPPSPLTFSYRAQSTDGQPLTGTIDADTAEQARQRLESLHLRVIELEPAAATAPGTRALRGDDFVTFNQQLAHLTAAGLPLEHGLRLIAQDMSRGRVSNTIRQIADDLERGQPLAAAFARHAAHFPPSYGRLIDAGVQTNNLSAILLSLARHLQTVARMRAALWRALAYPLMVFIALCFILAFIGAFVLPKFQQIFRDFGTKLPAITQFVLSVSDSIGAGAIGAAVLVIALLVGWGFVRRTERGAAIRDLVGLRLPLVGAVLRRSMIARWCDAVQIAVAGGMDLPAAMRAAAGAIGSPRLAGDVDAVAARLESGQPVDAGAAAGGSLIPATVTAAIELSSRHGALPQTMGTLADMYQQQARAKVGLIPAVLTPLLLSVLTGIIGVLIIALFAPLISLIQAVSVGGK